MKSMHAVGLDAVYQMHGVQRLVLIMDLNNLTCGSMDISIVKVCCVRISAWLRVTSERHIAMQTGLATTYISHAQALKKNQGRSIWPNLAEAVQAHL